MILREFDNQRDRPILATARMVFDLDVGDTDGPPEIELDPRIFLDCSLEEELTCTFAVRESPAGHWIAIRRGARAPCRACGEIRYEPPVGISRQHEGEHGEGDGAESVRDPAVNVRPMENLLAPGID